MQIFIGDRRSGKSTIAIKQASEKDLYIVCPDRAQVDQTMRLARELKLPIRMPITWDDFVNERYYGKNIKGFVIDNLDICVQRMTNVNIELATMHGRNPKPVKVTD